MFPNFIFPMGASAYAEKRSGGGLTRFLEGSRYHLTAANQCYRLVLYTIQTRLSHWRIASCTRHAACSLSRLENESTRDIPLEVEPQLSLQRPRLRAARPAEG